MIAAYLSQVFLIAFNIWMARYHSRLMKRDIRPKHGWWGGLYLAVAGGLSLWCGWWFFLASLLLRKFLFDIALNLYNGRGPFHVSTETTSIIDRIHYKLFNIHSEIYQTMYFMGWVVLMIKQAV